MQVSPQCEVRLIRILFCVTSRGACFTFSHSAELSRAFPGRGWWKLGFSSNFDSKNANISTMRGPIAPKSFLRDVSRCLLHFQPLSGAPTRVSWAGLVKNQFFVNFRPKNANISTMRGPIELKSFLRDVSRCLLHSQPLRGALALVSWAGLVKNLIFVKFEP